LLQRFHGKIRAGLVINYSNLIEVREVYLFSISCLVMLKCQIVSLA
jgi:hypothetical protein